MIDLRTKTACDDAGSGPCIFCGKNIDHVNEGGVGCVANAIVNGEKLHFAYCNDPLCEEHKKARAKNEGITTCSCDGPGIYDVVVGYKCIVCQDDPCEWDEDDDPMLDLVQEELDRRPTLPHNFDFLEEEE